MAALSHSTPPIAESGGYYHDAEFASDDFDGLPTVIDIPAERLSVDALRDISDAAYGSSPVLYSPARVPPGRATAMIPNRPSGTTQPQARGRASKATPPPRGSSSASTAGGAWSAAAWSAGAPPSVHTSPAAPLQRQPPSQHSSTATTKTRADPSPRPRTGVPQAWSGGGTPPPLHEQGAPTHADARASAAAFAAAAAMGVSPRMSLSTTGGERANPGRLISHHPVAHGGRTVGHAHEAGFEAEQPPLAPGMPPPKETPRERRLQQQRDALSQAVSIAQSSAAEAAVRVELLKGELYLAEDQTSRAGSLVAGGAAERAALRSQLEAMGAELRIARQANERLSSERLHSGAGARERAMSPAQARAREADEARQRLRPDASYAGGRGGGRGRGRGGVANGAMVLHGGRGAGGGSGAATSSERRRGTGGLGDRPALADSMTQTGDAMDEALGLGGGPSSPGAQAQVQGLRAELEALRAQVAEASARRKAELEGGERAHAAAMAAHGTSALHARLLWSEAHQLEEALAEAGATLARERRESQAALAEKGALVAELRGQLQQQETLHQQQLSRARADHRVLHRNSREYREGKNALEKQRDALEEQLAAFEDTRSALVREQKEKTRLLRQQATELHEHETRMQTLERSLSQARAAQKANEQAAEKAAKQGRADREVLVECVRQMASQLAAARAATEAANSQLVQAQGEAAERMRQMEDGHASESQRVQSLQAQVAECERQLQAEVERSQAASEASAATLRRAAEREAELETQLAQAEEAAAANGSALAAAHAESEAVQGAGSRAQRLASEHEAARRLEVLSLQSELRECETQLQEARGGEGAAIGERERLEQAVARLEAELQAKGSELRALSLEHSALTTAHELLAQEGAARSQLVDTLGERAREAAEAAETSSAALSADLATAEAMVRGLGDGRDAALAELKAERSEHEACRLQLISSQAALQRLRSDSAEVIATEGVRLTLALDELRRADRLAGVIHRSLHDAMRGAAEASGLLPPEPPSSRGGAAAGLGGLGGLLAPPPPPPSAAACGRHAAGQRGRDHQR